MHLLGAMTEEGLTEAVESPARQAGLLVEPGLVNLIVGEVAGAPGALPMLSHALQETWKLREGNTLTVAAYAATGGIRGAVAQSAEHVYASIGPGQRPLLRDLVLRLVTAGVEGSRCEVACPGACCPPTPQASRLIDLLVASRLVTSDSGVVEIAHEALARQWPRLRGWIDDDLAGQRILHHLTRCSGRLAVDGPTRERALPRRPTHAGPGVEGRPGRGRSPMWKSPSWRSRSAMNSPSGERSRIAPAPRPG